MTTSRDEAAAGRPGRAVGVRPRATQASRPGRGRPPAGRRAVGHHPPRGVHRGGRDHPAALLRRHRHPARRTRRPPGRGVLHRRVRRRHRPAHRGRQTLRRPRPGAALPPPPALETRPRRRPGRLESPPDRRPDPAPDHGGRQLRRPAPRPGRPQGPPQPRSTGFSRKPSPGTCPKKPKNAAAPPGTRPTSPSTTTASASPAPARSPASSTTLDALDLDDALRDEAQRIGDLGNTKTLDQRRATALGNIARRDLTLDYPTTTDQHRPAATARPRPAARRATRGRQVVLHLHLSESAVRGTPGDRGSRGRAGGEHPFPGHRRDHPRLGRPPRPAGHRQTRHRPRRPRLGRGLRSPRPDRRTRRPARHLLRLPLVHPTRPPTRTRPTPLLSYPG